MFDGIFAIFPSESFIDLSMYQYGWEQCNPFHSFGPAIRNHYLFHYVISGKGKLAYTDPSGVEHEYDLSADMGFLICPGDVTTRYYADGDDPWEYTWIEFDGLRVNEYLHLANLSTESPIYRPVSEELGHKVRDEMLYICHHKDHNALDLIGHLYLFLSNLTYSSIPAKQQGPISSMKDYYIREAINYIEQHYFEQITVEQMAKSCNLNRSYFTRLFKKATQSNPQDFLIKYRMTKASEFLKVTNYSIGKVSELVGYPNQLYFSKAFRSYFNMSPREYRNHFKQLASTTDDKTNLRLEKST